MTSEDSTRNVRSSKHSRTSLDLSKKYSGERHQVSSNERRGTTTHRKAADTSRYISPQRSRNGLGLESRHHEKRPDTSSQRTGYKSRRAHKNSSSSIGADSPRALSRMHQSRSNSRSKDRKYQPDGRRENRRQWIPCKRNQSSRSPSRINDRRDSSRPRREGHKREKSSDDRYSKRSNSINSPRRQVRDEIFQHKSRKRSSSRSFERIKTNSNRTSNDEKLNSYRRSRRSRSTSIARKVNRSNSRRLPAGGRETARKKSTSPSPTDSLLSAKYRDFSSNVARRNRSLQRSSRSRSHLSHTSCSARRNRDSRSPSNTKQKRYREPSLPRKRSVYRRSSSRSFDRAKKRLSSDNTQKIDQKPANISNAKQRHATDAHSKDRKEIRNVEKSMTAKSTDAYPSVCANSTGSTKSEDNDLDTPADHPVSISVNLAERKSCTVVRTDDKQLQSSQAYPIDSAIQRKKDARIESWRAYLKASSASNRAEIRWLSTQAELQIAEFWLEMMASNLEDVGKRIELHDWNWKQMNIVDSDAH